MVTGGLESERSSPPAFWLPLLQTPIYVSFVSKAILWERGERHHPAVRPALRPSVCPRFLSHMKARPEDVGPPRFMKCSSKPWPLCRVDTQPLPALKTHWLEGVFDVNTQRGGSLDVGSIPGRHSAASLDPFAPIPPVAPPPTPPRHSTQEESPGPIPTSTPPHPTLHPPDGETAFGSAGPTPPVSPTSLSRGSFSDWSRPPSSLLSGTRDLSSRGTIDLSSRGTGVLSSRGTVDLSSRGTADLPSMGAIDLSSRGTGVLSSRGTGILDSRGTSVLASNLSSRGGIDLSSRGTGVLSSRGTGILASNLSSRGASVLSSSRTSILCDGAADDILDVGSLSPQPSSVVLLLPASPPKSEPTLPEATTITTSSPCPCSRRNEGEGLGRAENHLLEASVDPGCSPVLDCDPLPTASSLLSPRPVLTPSPPLSQLGSSRWPVLPPISPFTGGASSRCSDFSCSCSGTFHQLDAVIPPSTSGLSLRGGSDSSGRPSPDTDLSPGLAALTVGCESGDLGSLSRVQLLLLDRPQPETLSPSGLEEEEDLMDKWADQAAPRGSGWTSGGVSRPPTASSVSERCDSAGKVQEIKWDQCEEDTGWKSSWIIDQTPSFDMFRSSPCHSHHGSHTKERGPPEEGSYYAARRSRDEASLKGRTPEHLQQKTQEEERKMEERKTKVLNVFSKLQDDDAHQNHGGEGRSNFEDFDFLAKYCIFSQEKLAEYKRAFEAVLLALKTIIPPGLLSDEEEIYVYKILEMVDFRVTDGLVDFRLFAVVASLAQRVSSMDDFMRSLISTTDFHGLEVRLFKAKRLFLFLLEDQQGAAVRPGLISTDQLLLELKAGGIQLQREAEVKLELQRVPPLDLLDFLAYLPLFMLIHKSIISNPLG